MQAHDAFKRLGEASEDARQFGMKRLVNGVRLCLEPLNSQCEPVQELRAILQESRKALQSLWLCRHHAMHAREGLFRCLTSGFQSARQFTRAAAAVD